MSRGSGDRPAPLTTASLHTLLCLVEGERHGYAIAREVEVTTQGRVKMGPGTLYGCLHRLRDGGFVAECDAPEESASERRRYYRLTETGRAALEDAASQLQGDLRLLQAKGVAPR